MRDLFNRFHPPIFIYGIIYYFSSLSSRNLDPLVPDFISHPLMYSVLSFFFFRLFAKPLRGKAMAWGMAILLLLALLDEGHQTFVPGRLFSLKDIGYDCLGVLIGLIARLGLYRYAESKGKGKSP
jgi:VanZ family protein